ncbi:MAG: hypothetical protein H0U64_02005 [Gemmatimonadaceae bacterium]|nr:hypothetical protein [Gemmatimonadaceae bacterium]
MADQYGATTLPATASIDYVDPLTYYLSAYLKAALNAQLGDAWASIAPGTDLVRSVFTADPAEVLFNASALPALFVWRPSSVHSTEKLADDFHVTTSDVRMFWLQGHDSSPKRQRRMQFAGLLSKAVHSALIEGCHPAWMVAGDADALSVTRGSILMHWSGLIRPPEVRSETLPVTMQIDDGDPVTYQAVVFTIRCVERLTRSIVDRSVMKDSAKMSAVNIRNGVNVLDLTDATDLEVERRIPTT